MICSKFDHVNESHRKSFGISEQNSTKIEIYTTLQSGHKFIYCFQTNSLTLRVSKLVQSFLIYNELPTPRMSESDLGSKPSESFDNFYCEVLFVLLSKSYIQRMGNAYLNHHLPGKGDWETRLCANQRTADHTFASSRLHIFQSQPVRGAAARARCHSRPDQEKVSQSLHVGASR